jgi:hypothetical protein
MTQDFKCIRDGELVKRIDMLPVMGIRFLEYMLLAYLLIWLRWLVWKIKSK